MKRTSKMVFVLLIGAGLLLGNASLSMGKGILRATFAWPTYADPAVGSDFSSSCTLVNVYDTLVYPTREGTVQPQVAKGWEVSEDGLTWTFHLRQGIKFHDGSELTAEDVAFSMDRLTTIGEGYAYLFTGRVTRSGVLDKYTVRFHLSEPFGPFLTNLVRLYLLNKEQVMEHLEKPGPYGELGDYGKKYLLTHDCGSGPYKIKEFRLEEYVLMEKNADYWMPIDKDAPDEVKFIATTEPVTVRTMISRRELEVSDQWQTEEGWKALDAIEGVDVTGFFMGGMFYYMMHTRKPPTDDVHFRKAMAWATDYAAVVRLFPGTHQAQGPVAVDFPGWNPEVFVYHRDLNKAREELKKSPYYDKLDEYPVELHWCAEVPDEEKVALLFMANMDEIGITINVVKTPWLKMVDEVASQEASPHIETIFVAPHYPEAGSILESRYHSQSAPTWEQNEWLLDPEIDRMIEEAIATIDTEERFAKYRKIQDKIVELCPSIFMFDQLERHAYQSTYVEWPAARGEVIPVMGYNFDCRLLKVYPEKREQLLK
ncbi:MAG: ABC transporter substrate-binding protein [bacterium]